MSGLLDTYNNMVAASEAHAQEEEAIKEAQALDNARVEVLTKYASAADNLLAEEYGDDYEESDVIELAHKMINHDIAQEENQEKVAEYVEAGQVMARAFISELNG
tara:strand:+ start:402 stop:716 length:315 start_codon:yes stop_codon:yes gene_type:complete